MYVCMYVCHGYSKLHVCLDDNDDVHFVLDQHAKLEFYSVGLWAGRHGSPLVNIILIPS